MSQTDTSPQSESGDSTTRAGAGRARRYTSKVAPYLRRGVESNAVTASIGALGLINGLRALRAGKRGRGLAKLGFGAAVLAVTIARRRSGGRGAASDVDESDVVDTGPDVESVADETGGAGEDDHATGDAATSVADTAPDIGDVGSGLESDSGSDAESTSVDQRDVVETGADSDALAAATEREPGDETDAADTATGTGDVDHLGEAAFDEQSREVPAPQQAFNRGFLAHSAEAFWGVRTRDDAVLVSQDYDAIEGRDGVEYVASSEIGTDVRELPIPDAVLDHWDEMSGGTAVTGGDDILFVTSDDLAAAHLLRVLPATWAGDAFGGEE